MPLRATILRLSPPLVFRRIVYMVTFPVECDSLEYYFAYLFLFIFRGWVGEWVGWCCFVLIHLLLLCTYLCMHLFIPFRVVIFVHFFFVFHFSIVLLYFSLKLLIYFISLFPIIILIESKCSLA